MNSFFSYLKNVRAEMAHVVWPNPKQAVLHVVVIILISAFVAIYIGGLDYGFTQLVGLFVAH
jgi:preprotein translocase SecE subunit